MLDANAATTSLPVRAGEDLLEGVFDVDLRSGVAAPIDVGAVAEERQHAFRAERREAMQVERVAGERGLIDLEVAGVDQHALRRADDHRHAVRHAVGDADELDLERPNREHVARRHRDLAVRRVDAVLLELGLDQRERQRRAVERTVDERQDVGDRADVILVAVGQDQRLDLPAPRLEVRQVRHDEVDPEQVGLREHRAGVDDDGRVPTRDGHRVEAELAEAAERHDINWQDARRRVVHRETHLNPSPGGAPGIDGPGPNTLRRHVGRLKTTAAIQAAGKAWKNWAGWAETIAQTGVIRIRRAGWTASSSRLDRLVTGPSDGSSLARRPNSSRPNVSGRRRGSIPARSSSILGREAARGDKGRQRVRHASCGAA